MLSSGKLRTALFLFMCLHWQDLFASDLRYYLILQVGVGESHNYIGSVTINDNIQALAAQIFFPGGQVVFIDMDIQSDGVTVNLQVSPNQYTYAITALSEPLTSSYAAALESGSGSPSQWFAVPALTGYLFQLPAIPGNHRLKLDKQVQNCVEDIRIRFNRQLAPEVRNMGYSLGALSLNPGQRTSGRQSGVVSQMTDQYLFQLFQLMIVALISPQLIAGRHSSSRFKRNMADPQQMLPLEIEVSKRRQGRQRKEVARGYMMWVWEGFQWMQQYVAGAMPEGFSNSPQGSYGVLNTPQGQKICFVRSLVNPVGFGLDPTVAGLLQQFSGMNFGTPPPTCRGGRNYWYGGGGYGGGPGPGWGGGSGGYMAR